MWRSGLGKTYPLTGSFVCRCLNSPSMLRFHIPLIEPDRRISRIRLSDKDSYRRPRKVASAQLQLDKTQRVVKILVGKTSRACALKLVFASQPLT